MEKATRHRTILKKEYGLFAAAFLQTHRRRTIRCLVALSYNPIPFGSLTCAFWPIIRPHVGCNVRELELRELRGLSRMALKVRKGTTIPSHGVVDLGKVIGSQSGIIVGLVRSPAIRKGKCNDKAGQDLARTNIDCSEVRIPWSCARVCNQGLLLAAKRLK